MKIEIGVNIDRVNNQKKFAKNTLHIMEFRVLISTSDILLVINEV